MTVTTTVDVPRTELHTDCSCAVLPRFRVVAARASGTMKLLTHNMLMSPGTRNGYPLAIEVEKMEVVESEFNAEFMVRMVDKIDYSALLTTIRAVRARSTASCMKSILNFLRSLPISSPLSLIQLAVESALPPAVPDKYAEDETFLTALHHALMEIEILEGQLVCPETSKKFPIKEGIPSML